MVGIKADERPGMRTRRPLSVNNSLVHGICNYSCQTCGVNKASYRGPREFQPLAVTERLIARVQEAATEGIRVRYIANSGDGEPTLHPEFRERMDLFGRMIRGWTAPRVSAPEVGVVTNGLRLLDPGILDAVADNGLTLLVSFPTPEPETYGRLVVGKPERGAALLSRVLPGILEAMRLNARGQLRRLHIHVSPPDREVVRRDFPATVESLTSMARQAGLDALSLVIFPATSNRTGLVRNEVRGVDFCGDLFRRFCGRTVNGVRVDMTLSFRRFFPRFAELLDLVRSFSLPCLWNAHLFVTAGGDSICCNDQAAREPMGSVLTHSIAELMRAKERRLPGTTCAGCDQRPERMRGSVAARAFALAARARLALARLGAGERRRRKEAGDALTAEKGRPILEDGAARGALPATPPVSRNRPLRAGRPRARVTQILRALEAEVERGAAAPGRFAFGGGKYAIRVANDRESREKAYRLVYALYLEREYAKPSPAQMWLSVFDALPGTATLLVERTDSGAAVGAVTVVFDSPAGLPADNLYRAELDRLRSAGRRVAEVTSLGVAGGCEADSQVLVKLFNYAYFIARGVRGATDFVVTVNPRHVRFYRRLMLFSEAGPERDYGKVGGAPALLLRLDFDVAEEQRRRAATGGQSRATDHRSPMTGRHSIYSQFRAVGEEPETVSALGGCLRPMSGADFGYFLVAETDALAKATAEQRARILSG